MSYILDALKKSEQERGHGNIPGVQTVHSSSLSYRNEKSVYWPYVLITAVIINISLVLYFILDKEPTANDQAEVANITGIKNHHEENTTDSNISSSEDSDVTEQNAIESPAVVVKTEPKVTRSVSTVPQTATHKTTTSTTEGHDKSGANTVKDTRPSESFTEDNTTVIDFYSLSDSIKQQLPAIIISAHVYSSNPMQRSIVINNKFMEEGEYVLDNLMLHEITSAGAIFDFNGTRFSYSVISSWQ